MLGFTMLGNTQTHSKAWTLPRQLYKYLTRSDEAIGADSMIWQAATKPCSAGLDMGPLREMEWGSQSQAVGWGLSLGWPQISCPALSESPTSSRVAERSGHSVPHLLLSESDPQINAADSQGESYIGGAYLSPLTMQEAWPTN